MAELGNGTTKDNSPRKKEVPMERRLLLAFLLMGLVLFLTPYFYRPSRPPPKTQPPVGQQARAPEAPVPEAAKPPEKAQQPPVPDIPGRISAEKEETFVVETDLYRVVLSNRGATVRSWVLKKYNDGAGRPLELVNAAGAVNAGYPLSVIFKNRNPAVDLNDALYVAKLSDGGLVLDFEFSDGHVFSRKSFRFRKARYLCDVSSEVVQNGSTLPHVLAWRGGFGDRTVPNHAARLRSLYFDASENKLIVKEAKEAKEGPVSAVGNYSFAGIEDAYFAAAFLPVTGSSSVELQTFSDMVADEQQGKDVPHAGAGVGGSGRNRLALFVGPKDIDILREVNPKLEQVVDFGWFGFIAKPLFLAVNWVNNRFVNNYGWSIVVVTVIINFLLLPLKYTSLKSMKKMQALQPHIAAINAKYKGIGIRDPRKAEQNQEIMELYKKHGVNPMGGCVPMLLQIPFFFAFYKVLTVAIEMRGATWLWVTDLSQPEHLPIRILPIAMIVSQFIMQKMTPTTTADPSQQRVMMLMPLVLGFMFYGVSSGLVLYWLTGNLVGIAQQWFFNRTTAPVVVQPAPAKRRKRVRK